VEDSVRAKPFFKTAKALRTIMNEQALSGQVMLALKQNGMRLPEKISIQGLWGKWIWGK